MFWVGAAIPGVSRGAESASDREMHRGARSEQVSWDPPATCLISSTGHGPLSALHPTLCRSHPSRPWSRDTVEGFEVQKVELLLLRFSRSVVCNSL